MGWLAPQTISDVL